MKIIVIGGTGRIGSSVVTKLRESGFEAVAASPNSGVDTLTGEGLAGRYLGARDDPRSVIADPRSRHFGAELDDQTLVPADGARLAPTRFHDWLSRTTAGPYAASSSSRERPRAETDGADGGGGEDVMMRQPGTEPAMEVR